MIAREEAAEKLRWQAYLLSFVTLLIVLAVFIESLPTAKGSNLVNNAAWVGSGIAITIGFARAPKSFGLVIASMIFVGPVLAAFISTHPLAPHIGTAVALTAALIAACSMSKLVTDKMGIGVALLFVGYALQPLAFTAWLGEHPSVNWSALLPFVGLGMTVLTLRILYPAHLEHLQNEEFARRGIGLAGKAVRP